MLAKTRRLLKDNSGVAMIYSLVIGIVVMIFAVMLLMVTYTLYASSSRQTGQTQCRIMADSYAECLKGELNDSESTVYKYISEQLKAGEKRIELDLIQENYTIYTQFEQIVGVGSGHSADDDKTTETDDNDPVDGETDDNEPDEGNTPGGGQVPPTPGNGPSGDDDTPAAPIQSGRTVELKATIKCNKGGTGGIGEQSYTLTQNYKIKVE